jgi:hypothetical protein
VFAASAGASEHALSHFSGKYSLKQDSCKTLKDGGDFILPPKSIELDASLSSQIKLNIGGEEKKFLFNAIREERVTLFDQDQQYVTTTISKAKIFKEGTGLYLQEIIQNQDPQSIVSGNDSFQALYSLIKEERSNQLRLTVTLITAGRTTEYVCAYRVVHQGQ